jgi:hypothetical protein
VSERRSITNKSLTDLRASGKSLPERRSASVE